MRKILTILFSFMMVFTLFGCGDKNNDNGETTDNNDVEQVAVFLVFI